MKHLSHVMLLAAMVTVLFSSCAKIIDYKKHHPGADEHLCNIEKFFIRGYNNTTGVPGPSIEYDISYNAKGNPVRLGPLDYSHMIGYISYYTYDKKDRLINYRLEAINSPTDSGVIFEHRYYYTPDNKMIVDTEYQLPPDPFPRVDYYRLDSEGRIIKDSTGGNVANYNYDANGNLASITDFFGSTVYNSYDDKVNWRQTSKTWQMIDLNYSRNNKLDPDPGGSFTITGYNSFGLPLQFVRTPTPPNYGMNSWEVFTAAYLYDIWTIQYACDAPVGPHK